MQETFLVVLGPFFQYLLLPLLAAGGLLLAIARFLARLTERRW